ncbi:hypothetical protein ACFC26_07990 [Kitasatospora purpeofusca]|uniref:hypothetical protein n=1 Tax=Kitasatospora purpeofusca TaxID=67352 RepID=UPI0035E361AB
MARLSTYVHVTDDAGRPVVLGPDDEVPAWAVALIVNPKAWAEAPDVAEPAAEPVKPPAAKRAPARRKATADAVQRD